MVDNKTNSEKLALFLHKHASIFPQLESYWIIIVVKPLHLFYFSATCQPEEMNNVMTVMNQYSIALFWDNPAWYTECNVAYYQVHYIIQSMSIDTVVKTHENGFTLMQLNPETVVEFHLCTVSSCDLKGPDYKILARTKALSQV